jgi:hypothetical protein
MWRIVMQKLNLKLDLPATSDLERVIEPLASYICAADQPRAALLSALAVLLSEVEQTNRAASHFGAFTKSH